MTQPTKDPKAWKMSPTARDKARLKDVMDLGGYKTMADAIRAALKAHRTGLLRKRTPAVIARKARAASARQEREASAKQERA